MQNGCQRGLMSTESSSHNSHAKVLKKWEIILYISVLVLYAAASIYLMFCHEVWRDESQAWVLAKQLSWTQIPSICQSEGHPCLWFYLVKISIVLGLPFKYFGLLSITFMTLAAGLFLFRSDFHWISKILVILSPLFFYYNPVICRIYSALMLLICALCALWKDRHEKPLIYALLVALLFQSHVLIFGLAIGCTLDMGINLIMNRKHRDIRHFAGLFIAVFSFALMILELKQDPGSSNYINITFDYILNRLKEINWLSYLLSVSVPLDINEFRIGFVVLLAMLLAVIVFLFLAFDPGFRKEHLNEGLVFLCAAGVYFGIIIFVRTADHIQMSIVLCMIVLFFFWTLRDVKKGWLFEILLLLMCVPLIPKSLVIDPLFDIRDSYSGSKEMAEMIEENAEDGSVILINNNYLSTSMIAYLSDSPKKFVFWDIDNDREFFIHKWGEDDPVTIDETNIGKFAEGSIKNGSLSGSIYYVKGNTYVTEIKNGQIHITGVFDDDTRIYEPDVVTNKALTLIGRNRKVNTWNEYYLLYKFNKQHA